MQESFLEDVNSILNSGEVPDLFDNEEIDGIAMDLEFAAVQAQVPATRRAIYQFFVQVCTSSFSPFFPQSIATERGVISVVAEAVSIKLSRSLNLH